MSKLLHIVRFETGVAFLLGAGVAGAQGSLDPLAVDASLHPNEVTVVTKTVTTPTIPPLVDVCLLEDETGSFYDDIGNLRAAAPDIYDAVVAESPGAEFAVAGFRDYPYYPYGGSNDWVYRLISTMSSDKTAWVNGVNALTAGGGSDTPEAQYDAIVAAVNGIDDPTLGYQNPCGFSPDPNVTKVLLVATDAPFHTPDGTHVNDATSTATALNAVNVKLIGLKAPGAGAELDALAIATGGSVQAISSNSADIAAAILAGLTNLPVTVEMTSDCEWPIGTSFEPAKQTVTSGESAVFTETISVANDALPNAVPNECNDWALLNGEPMTDDSGDIIYEHKSITVLDGFMTGGGSVFTQDGVRVTHGLELHCASALLPNNLQVNWNKGNKFHLDTLTYAKCSDNPNIGEEAPVAGFDTMEGAGTGSYNGVPGAVVRFVFTDAGEPGTFDSAYIEVEDSDGNTVVTVSGTLNNGNQQAHPYDDQ